MTRQQQQARPPQRQRGTAASQNRALVATGGSSAITAPKWGVAFDGQLADIDRTSAEAGGATEGKS